MLSEHHTWKFPPSGNSESNSNKSVVVGGSLELTVGEVIFPRNSNLLVTLQILNLLEFPMILEIIFDKWLECIWKSVHSWIQRQSY